jgi:hypothetical protein
MANETNIPTPDFYFCKHYIGVNEKNEIVALFSLPKGTAPPEGSIYLHDGLTQPMLFPDEPESENATLFQRIHGGTVYLYRYEDGNPVRKPAGEINAEIEALRIADLPQQVRSTRDGLLLASDWTDLPHAPLSDGQKAAWQTYRQALRDVTEQEGFPADVVWPEKPA